MTPSAGSIASIASACSACSIAIIAMNSRSPMARGGAAAVVAMPRAMAEGGGVG